ncbi:MAG: hypothetical protein QNL02_14100 [Paracoccaceae bacterium]|jgi:pantothenate kinase
MPHQKSIMNGVSAVMAVLPPSKERLIIAVAGPPAAGKSTLAEALVETLNQDISWQASLLQMDGFHLDNLILKKNGTLSRKGSPDTFDFEGFMSLLLRVRDQSKDHYAPTFDRSRDIAVAGSAIVRKEARIVVVDGNYLLLDKAPWNELSSCFDLRVLVEAPLSELRRRLIQRWLDNGYDEEGATARAELNDIPNAKLVLERRGAVDLNFTMSTNSHAGLE